MGYNTQYGLQLIDTAGKIDEFTKEWLKEARVAVLYDCKWTDQDGYFRLWDGEAVKWYNHHEELIEISRRYPTIVFILDGDGEEKGDVWRKFYLDGAFFEWRLEVQSPPEWGDSIHAQLVVDTVMGS